MAGLGGEIGGKRNLFRSLTLWPVVVPLELLLGTREIFVSIHPNDTILHFESSLGMTSSRLHAYIGSY